jgi:hypothetical protein
VTHHFLNEHRGLTDLATFLCAGVAVVSLSQAALVVSIIAGLVSIILGGIRVHDRMKYGHGGKAE